MEHNSKTFGQNQGRPRCNDRITINGILFVLSVGCRWEEMPAQYGSKSTAHILRTTTERNLEKDSIWFNQNISQTKQD